MALVLALTSIVIAQANAVAVTDDIAVGTLVVSNAVGAELRADAFEHAAGLTAHAWAPALFAQQDIARAGDPSLQLSIGVRAHDARVHADGVLDDSAPAPAALAAWVAPRVSTTWSWADLVDVSVRAGARVHPDGRAHASGAEVAASTSPDAPLLLDGAAFAIALADGTPWSDDVVGGTRRLGVAVGGRLRADGLAPWLSLEARAMSTAPSLISSDAAARVLDVGPSLSGALVIDGDGDGDGAAGFSARLGALWSTTHRAARVDGAAGWSNDDVTMAIEVKNIAAAAGIARTPTYLALADEDACFGGTGSALDAVGTFRGCDDLHFTQDAPVNARITATFRF